MLSNRSCSDAARQPGTGAVGDAPQLSTANTPGTRGRAPGTHPTLPQPRHRAPRPQPLPLPARDTPRGQSPVSPQALQGTHVLFLTLPPRPDTPDTALRPQSLPPVIPEQFGVLRPDLLHFGPMRPPDAPVLASPCPRHILAPRGSWICPESPRAGASIPPHGTLPQTA